MHFFYYRLIHIDVPVFVCAYVCIYIYIYIYIYIHTHTHMYNETVCLWMTNVCVCIYIYIKMNRSTKWEVFFKKYLFCPCIHACFQLVAFVREHMWHKALWMGYLMRFDECSLVECFSGFVWVYIKVTPSFPFLECVYFVCFYPQWVIDIWYVIKVLIKALLWVVMCLFKWFQMPLTVTFSLLCVCVCVVLDWLFLCVL